MVQTVPHIVAVQAVLLLQVLAIVVETAVVQHKIAAVLEVAAQVATQVLAVLV